MKILVTGNGVLANELREQYYDNIVCLDKDEMDIRDSKKVEKELFLRRPDVIIHTAAITKPMKLNDEYTNLSIETNIIGSSIIANLCFMYNIRLIYISTDFMYLNEMEWNNYAKSKKAGELATLMLDNSLVLRCALQDIPFRHKIAYDDVYRNSITHKDIAETILNLAESKHTGIINIGGKFKSVYSFVKDYQDIELGHSYGKIPSISIEANNFKTIIVEK